MENHIENRVVVTIGGRGYTILAEEGEQYIHKVAKHVDEKVQQMINEAHLSLTDAAVLTAMNLADDYFKTESISENLRGQLKEYLEEASRTKMELSETKRALSKLQGK